ncbi:MAG: N-6 DNA methylase [Candidatus Daviesbacteria bacterium]|nr:N-6 DNA methylase [Candidatus Daviesbacteria bacterium]
MNEEYISIADIARILGISKQAVNKQLRGKINSGEIEVKTEGKKDLIKYSTLPKEVKDRIEGSKKEAVEQAKEIVGKPQQDIHFAKDLWAAADRLRGNIDASEYKHVVLGLIFLKYISDAFYQRREKMGKWMEDKSSKFYIPNPDSRNKLLEDRDMYRKESIFYIPSEARWDFLRGKASATDVAQHIDNAMDAIEKENPDLQGVLPKIFVRVPLENHIIGELINIFSRIDFGNDENQEKDMLGRVYEYFLGQFADAEGKRGGEFFTPRPIVKLLVEVLEPYEDSRVLDPAAGSGGMFVQSSKFLQEHHKNATKIAIYGQESNQTTLRLCKMNLAIRGVFGHIELGNSYYNDRFPDLKTEFILSNPPFNAEWEPDRLSDKDPRLEYGTPPKGNANFLWIQHFIHHLTPNGMAGFVMANGALAVSGKEGEIRKKIIEDDLIDVIIACPPKLFFNVSLPVSLWFLTKNKESGRFRNRKGETLFIDARETFTQISRKQVEFTDDQIQKIADTVRAWRGEGGEYKDIAGFCRSATQEEIAKNGYVLTPGRYVGVEDEIDDGIPFTEKMQKLETDLKQYFEEGKKLEKEILENLRKVKT